ncbi:serine/threonine-protein kinase [Leifsonia sp. 22587]|uniref:serine/threonine-protein kinase n=1 Tax=Leifsonia sp. 22587 TaxID=3453946 RepID=UPI003F83D33C
MSRGSDAEHQETPITLLPDDPFEIGGIRIVGRLGAGASSTVYLGSTGDGKSVAVKVLRTEGSTSREVRALLTQEALLLERVRGTRVARVLDVNAVAEMPYLVTEYVPGSPLSERLPAQPLRGAELYTVLSGIADALVNIHDAGVVHRDLKPANILYGSDGVRVIDFGIGVLSEVEGASTANAFAGTPGWISPEQATGDSVRAASDIFAFGLLIAYLSTGTFPFGQGRPDAILYRVVNSDPNVAHVPDGLKELALACMSKDPSARPAAAQVAYRLAQLSGMGESSEGASPPTVIASPTVLGRNAAERAEAAGATHMFGGLRRRPVLVAASAVLVVLLIVLGVVTANAVAPLGGAIAVTYDLKAPSNSFSEAPTLRVSVDKGKSRSLQLDQLSDTKTLASWKPGSRITVSYEPVFKNDQRYSKTFAAEELGMSLFTVGQPLTIRLHITDDKVRLALAPSSLWGSPKPRTVVLDRANETQYVTQEYEGYKRCVSATSAAWSSRLATLIGIRESYNSVQAAHGYTAGGTASWDVWASRAKGLANDLFAQLATATEQSKAPLTGGAAEYTEGVKRTADAVSNALSAVITDWDSYSNAIAGLSPSQYGNLNDLLPRQNTMIQMDVKTLWSSVDDLIASLPGGADTACRGQYPDAL